MDATEFSVDDTHGFTKLDGFNIHQSSEGLRWSSIYLSVQSEAPYSAEFDARTALLISVLDAGAIRARLSARDDVKPMNGLPGSVTVIPDKMAFHADLQTSIETTHLYLRRTVLDEVAEGMFTGDPSHHEFFARISVFDPVLVRLAHAVRDALDEDATSSALFVDHMAHALAAHLIVRHSNAGARRRQAQSPGGLSAREFDRARDMIDANLDKSLTNAGLAADSGYGAEHFGRLFKRTAGVTLHQFVIARRVDRARDLLTNTTRPIAEIAHECGFVDQVHLTRVFGRIVGTTPASFRKERQG